MSATWQREGVEAPGFELPQAAGAVPCGFPPWEPAAHLRAE